MSSAARQRSQRQLTERVFDLLDHVDLRLAVTEEERDAIFRLRYKAYLREGAIEPNSSERLTDRFDTLDNAWLVGIHLHGELAACIRIHVTRVGSSELPATGVFDDYLRGYIDLGKTVVDPTRIVVDQDISRDCPELIHATTRVGWMTGDFFDADAIIATARREHQAFYARTFGFQVVCPPRKYYALTKPLSLMLLDYRAMRERVLERFPFYRSTHFERRSLFEGPGMAKAWSPSMHLKRTVPAAPTLVADNTTGVRDTDDS